MIPHNTDVALFDQLEHGLQPRRRLLADAGLPADRSGPLQTAAAELEALAAQLREAAGRTLGLAFDQRQFLARAGARLGEIGATLDEAAR